MREAPTRPAWGRWVLSGLLVLVLFGLGTQPEPLFAALTRGWQALFEALGLGELLQRVQRGTSSQVTMRSLPAMLTYGVLYVALCLLLLRLLLPDARSWRLAVAGYGVVLLLCVVLLALGKLAGDVALLYRAARQLIDFVTSPLPIAVLLPLLSPRLRRSLLRQE